MTGGEFINATSRLETYFGKEYTDEQRKIMFEILKDWSIEKYKKAVKYCLENCKYLPKIVDFKTMDINTRPDIREQNKIEFTECKKCCQGFISYKRKYEKFNYEYIALCTCENGQKQKLNGYIFPTIAELGIKANLGKEVNSNTYIPNNIQVNYKQLTNFVR